MPLSRRTLLGSATAGFTLLIAAACGSQQNGSSSTATAGTSSAAGAKTVSIKHAQGTTEVPLNPTKVYSFDLAVVDSLEALGLEVQGVPKLKYPDFLKKYDTPEKLVIGASKEPDFEKIATAKPDLIIISTRTAKSYKELSKIAPTIDLSVDPAREKESFTEHMTSLGQIFGKEAEVKSKLKELEDKAAAIAAQAKGKGTTLLLMASGGEVTAFGPGSRFGVLFSQLGLTSVPGVENKDRHGQAVSFEFIKEKNPDRIYVLDRDMAIGSEKPGSSAKEVLDNDLVNSTKAAKNSKIIYVNPASWYLLGPGLANYSRMFDDVQRGL